MKQEELLVTGGSGLLGKEIKKILPNALYPVSKIFNVTNYEQLDRFIDDLKSKPTMLLHCAAFTSPPRIDKDPQKAIDVNIIGTGNVVKICMKYNIKMIYISTDYIFTGEKGNYSEEDPVFPVNKYAWSKLGGETSVMMYDNSLVIRLSFGPNVFPYETAFTDQWTSREPVSMAAEKIVKLIKKNVSGIIHIGSKRRTVFEYAKSLDEKKDIRVLSIKDINFKVPADTSLNTLKYDKLMSGE